MRVRITKRRLSKAARAAISRAQKQRWARSKHKAAAPATVSSDHNLMGQLWTVQRVWEENGPEEIVVTQDLYYALGHGELLGMFIKQEEAEAFAVRVPQKYRVVDKAA